MLMYKVNYNSELFYNIIFLNYNHYSIATIYDK